MTQLNLEIEQKQQNIIKCNKLRDEQEMEFKRLTAENGLISEQRTQVDNETKANQETKKRCQKNYNRLNKDYDDNVKATKKLQNQISKIQNEKKSLDN